MNKIIDFDEHTKLGVRLTSDDIKVRRLDIIIPKNSASEAQRAALGQIRAYGLDNNVVLRVIER